MKRQSAKKDLRAQPTGPSFLRPHVEEEIEEEPVSRPRSAVFRPNWGFRKQDTVIGDPGNARDWSLHSITPCDYTDYVLKKGITSIELLGSQAFATVSKYLSFLVL